VIKLGEGFRDALAEARSKVIGASGHVLVAMVEGMGYRIVPAAFVETFTKMLDRDDARQEAAEKGSEADR
jgi:hypothetical protein